MSDSPSWYIVKNASGQCEIILTDEISQAQITERWGPFPSKSEAIARRIGLIRSGKCEPV
jgi:hypothetical protein